MRHDDDITVAGVLTDDTIDRSRESTERRGRGLGPEHDLVRMREEIAHARLEHLALEESGGSTIVLV